MPGSPVPPVVVVGDDGSPAADVVWQWVTAHPWDGWAVDIVTADDTDIAWGRPVVGDPWNPPWRRAAEPSGARSMRHLKYACDPRAMLAERSDASLMVVGRHRREASERFLLGSTSEWLLQHPPSPLAVVGTATPMRRVTICVDGSEHAEAALDAFAALPAARDAAVTVLTVDDGRTDSALASQTASDRLAGVVATLEPVAVEGRPTRAILEHLAAETPDLAVLGTKGLTGWKRLRLGSTAGAVARQAECNVLVASAGSE